MSWKTNNGRDRTATGGIVWHPVEVPDRETGQPLLPGTIIIGDTSMSGHLIGPPTPYIVADTALNQRGIIFNKATFAVTNNPNPPDGNQYSYIDSIDSCFNYTATGLTDDYKYMVATDPIDHYDSSVVRAFEVCAKNAPPWIRLTLNDPSNIQMNARRIDMSGDVDISGNVDISNSGAMTTFNVRGLAKSIDPNFLQYDVATGNVTYGTGGGGLDLDCSNIIDISTAWFCDDIVLGTIGSNPGIAIGENAGGIGTIPLFNGPLPANTIAIGNNAGQTDQSFNSVAIGNSAGHTRQDPSAVAIGPYAGYQDQSYNSVAIGAYAGYSNQDSSSVAIGPYAGQTNQGVLGQWNGGAGPSTTLIGRCVAIGDSAGRDNQAFQGVAIGYQAGETDQSSNTVAVGPLAGRVSQGHGSTAVGIWAGRSNQGLNAVAIGSVAAQNNQGTHAIAIGNRAGWQDQDSSAVAIGPYAGYSDQSFNSVAIGNYAGYQNQSYKAVAIGSSAGKFRQDPSAVAIGPGAGWKDQSYNAVAVGSGAGNKGQGHSSVAIGRRAGHRDQSDNAVAIGYHAGRIDQSSNAIAIGGSAGQTNQGRNSIAIGNLAGETDQSANSIVLNATGVTFDITGENTFYVKPIRKYEATDLSALLYDSNTGEITYGAKLGGGSGLDLDCSNIIDISTAWFCDDIVLGTIGSNPGIAIGENAGGIGTTAGDFANLSTNSIAIGNSAGGDSNQDIHSIAIGFQAGQQNQKDRCVAIGMYAGQQRQNSSAVAIGHQAGFQDQSYNSVAIGSSAGFSNQNSSAVAIGSSAGWTDQSNNSVAIGTEAGYLNQDPSAVAIGPFAGYSDQSFNSVAIGNYAGYQNQSYKAVAIGSSAGKFRQDPSAVAIGPGAGWKDQSYNAVAVGSGAGNKGQGHSSVAIGRRAGHRDQSDNAVAIGYHAGRIDQSSNAIAIGGSAGQTNQGRNSIAIGNLAGQTDQSANSIVLNATGVTFDITGENTFYVKPIRKYEATDLSALNYNSSTGEITYGGGGSGGLDLDCSNAVDVSGIFFCNGTSVTTFDVGQWSISGSVDICANLDVSGTLAVGGVPNTPNANTLHYDPTTGAVTYQVNITPSGFTGDFDCSNAVDVSGIYFCNGAALTTFSGDWLSVSGDLDMSKNTIQDVSGIFFKDGTYIGTGSSFDISSNSTIKFSVPEESDIVVIDVCGITHTGDLTSRALGHIHHIVAEGEWNQVTMGPSAPALPDNEDWRGIAMSSDGTRIVVVGQNTYPFTSADAGVTWIERTGAASVQWRAVSCNYEGDVIIASLQGSSTALWRSVDYGVTWTNPGTTFQNKDYTGLGMERIGSTNLGAYMGVNSGTQTWFVTNNAGAGNWFSPSLGGQASRDVAVSADGTKVILVASGVSIIYNGGPLGASWQTTVTGFVWLTAAGTARSWRGVTNSENGLIAYACADGEAIWKSTNYGANWAVTSSPVSKWLDVTTNYDGTKTQAVDYNTGEIWQSLDSGANWAVTTIDRATPAGGTSGFTDLSFNYIASSQYGTKAAAIAGPNASATGGDISGSVWVMGFKVLSHIDEVVFKATNASESKTLFSIDVSGKAYVEESLVFGTDIVIGTDASNRGIAIGYEAGNSDQSANAVAIGSYAGQYRQDNSAVAIGPYAGWMDQNFSSVAIGNYAGYQNQEYRAIAIGDLAGQIDQSAVTIAIGYGAGQTKQSWYGIAIGKWAGNDTQGEEALAIGSLAGEHRQDTRAIAIGQQAGWTDQSYNAVAIGSYAGYQNQSYNAVAIGPFAGNTGQMSAAIAIGYQAGYQDQSFNAIAIGQNAGQNGQKQNAIAIGVVAGQTGVQGNRSIAIGENAGNDTQGDQCVAMGYTAGMSKQGDNSVAIGYKAGQYDQSANSIVLNATGVSFDVSGENTFYVKPIREHEVTDLSALLYDSNTGEITFGLHLGGGEGGGLNLDCSNIIDISTAWFCKDIVIGSRLQAGIAIGRKAGGIGEDPGGDISGSGYNTIAIGATAGQEGQNNSAIAIGQAAGAGTGGGGVAAQGTQAIAIGTNAGQNRQGGDAIAIGSGAGQNDQLGSTIAIGVNAGNTSQDVNTIAIGNGAGQTDQGGTLGKSVAIGFQAGNTSQGTGAIAIGDSAGGQIGATQDNYSIAIGAITGYNLGLGLDSIYIGHGAGQTSTAHANNIIIDATGAGTILSGGANRCYIDPMRTNGPPNTGQVMWREPTTKEVQLTGEASLSSWLTINATSLGILQTAIKPFIIDHPIREDYKLIYSCIEGPQVDLIYRGKIKLQNGYGEINIDKKNGMTNGTFEALCRDIQSFTTNETGWEPVRSKVVRNILQIECKDKESEDTISWMVIGERKDKALMRDKMTDEVGKLITEQPNSIAGNWRSNC